MIIRRGNANGGDRPAYGILVSMYGTFEICEKEGGERESRGGGPEWSMRLSPRLCLSGIFWGGLERES